MGAVSFSQILNKESLHSTVQHAEKRFTPHPHKNVTCIPLTGKKELAINKCFYDEARELKERRKLFVLYHWFQAVLRGQIFPFFSQALWDLPATQEVCAPRSAGTLINVKNRQGAAPAFSLGSLRQNLSGSVWKSDKWRSWLDTASLRRRTGWFCVLITRKGSVCNKRSGIWLVITLGVKTLCKYRKWGVSGHITALARAFRLECADQIFGLVFQAVLDWFKDALVPP